MLKAFIFVSGMAKREEGQSAATYGGANLTPCSGAGWDSPANCFVISLSLVLFSRFLGKCIWLTSSRTLLRGLWEMESDFVREKHRDISEMFPHTKQHLHGLIKLFLGNLLSVKKL